MSVRQREEIQALLREEGHRLESESPELSELLLKVLFAGSYYYPGPDGAHTTVLGFMGASSYKSS